MKTEQLKGVLRILLGLMFLLIGIFKVFVVPGAMTGAFAGYIGDSAGLIVGWIWSLGELVFGAGLLIGYKTKLSAKVLTVFLALAAIFGIFPNFAFNPTAISFSAFHIIGVVLLLILAKTGSMGIWSIDKK